MGNVVILDENTINKIAAGEVVDKPVSIVKELVENSIDAKSKNITVEIKNGGIKQIIVSDDGTGILSDDILLAFERHATSKIRQEEDIYKIKSMGFRGEALASIAAISKVTLSTKHITENLGTRIKIDSGKFIEQTEIPFNNGTTIVVEDVFHNVPARYKFLNKDYKEASYIEDIITYLALANPQISFKYINNSKKIFSTLGDSNLKTTIFSLMGRNIASNLIEVNYEQDNITVKGFIGTPVIARATRKNEMLYVNSRYVKSKTMIKALEKAFEQNLNIGKFPFGILNVDISSEDIDVNVHPSKTEVKFKEENKIFEVIYYGVKNAIKNYRIETSPFKNNQEEYIEKEAVIIETEKVQEEQKLEHSKLNSGFDYMQNINNGNSFNSKFINKDYSSSERNNDYINNNKKLEIREVLEVYDDVFKDKIEKIKYKHVGCLFNTYILIEIDQKLYIIDQHAAHERLIYEKIKENYNKKESQTQMILMPFLIELKSSEKEKVLINKSMFEKAGFILEDFGDTTIKITGVPNIGYDLDYKDIFMDILDENIKEEKTQKEEKEERFIATLACKAAVKANMVLDKLEQINLIDEMIKLENPFTCPHGRPTAYEISKYEIERRFSRK